MPRVSIVIPTHNRAHCLMRALRSVLAQEFCDWSLTVVDDASTDGTEALIDQVRPLFGARLTYSKIPSSGASAARNLGIAGSDAEWIAFLDSDDFWIPHKLGLQMQSATVGAPAFIYTDHFTFTDRKGIATSTRPLPADMHGSVYPQLLEVRCNVITCPSVMIRRTVLDDIGGFDETMAVCEDIDLWRRAARGRQVGVIAAPLVGVHIREGGPFLYASALRGRHRLYEKAAEDDPEISGVIPRYYLELLDTYCAVAAERGDRTAMAALSTTRRLLATSGVTASDCHAAVKDAVRTLDAPLHAATRDPVGAAP